MRRTFSTRFPIFPPRHGPSYYRRLLRLDCLGHDLFPADTEAAAKVSSFDQTIGVVGEGEDETFVMDSTQVGE